ncbi:hypothetical protein DUI87_33757 [Hirundo rustica rustica]|uniref:Uncharacterized protein n=1 Tax=Hirundo rustica rustica TaxID=333673 RepID=A0A3M0IN10_HIRRU|nr:hypothetical protein DUI87_33757 [Hirundo rustica rustica]
MAAAGGGGAAVAAPPRGIRAWLRSAFRFATDRNDFRGSEPGRGSGWGRDRGRDRNSANEVAGFDSRTNGVNEFQNDQSEQGSKTDQWGNGKTTNRGMPRAHSPDSGTGTEQR